ncbi:hypothetical protein [Agromyces cerinus]|uniref:Lipoprotein n=1 Tax=Agromyces cerinus subsp. cerinus TaxID=232089 RepID=A0A1N6HDP1_9MICO|nr:hypothetical protein [Agromyces cerinus]SIO17912.1 hypothetical protein SAMN05443544_3099 [Agromyces cerinus subsp. cerinus]
MNHYTALRGVIATAASFGLAVTLLTGCSAAPEPPSPSIVASEAPSPAPTRAVEPLDAVTTLVVRPQALELRAADGSVVQSLDYLSDAAAAVETLTTVFGAPPTVEEDAGSSSELPSTVRRWAGVELSEPKYPDAASDASPGPWYPNFRVAFTAAASGDVELTTDSGHVVGEPWADFAASPDAAKNGLCAERYGEVVVLPRTPSDGTVEDARTSGEFQASDDETVIASVEGPRVMHRDGCA